MKKNIPTLVFGEALYDCFSDDKQVLGGAPFNVAWHLQALGNQPLFISRVGNDKLGQKILKAMKDWGMSAQSIQVDTFHQTGQVQVIIKENEPTYDITANCAYDFISTEVVQNLPDNGILYHGTLGLRNNISRNCLAEIAQQSGLSVFLDVNLRSPWWQHQDVFEWLEQAYWVKLNEHELKQLGFNLADISDSMHKLLTQFQLEQLILTQGAKGAIVLTAEGSLYQQTPPLVDHIVDTVGAGDGFSALWIHGLKSGWSIEKTLTIAQQFAAKIIGMQGAITNDSEFYREILS